MDPFVFFEVFPCALGEFDGVNSEHIFHTPHNGLSTRVNLSKATDSSHHFSSTVYWAAHLSEQTFVAEFASRIRLVNLAYGRMPLIT